MAELDRCCDLVMKGGVTSGVVYPKMVEEVAKRFHLVGIAGTSAGAIAASLAAAAEYRRRQTGSFEGFERLAELGSELAADGKLLELFTPDRGTRKLFATLINLQEKGLTLGTKLRFAKMLLRLEKTLEPVRSNFFGLCTGMANGNAKPGAEPLSAWLARRIDEVAGKTDGAPLTFSDLHTAKVPAALARLLPAGGTERSIDFRAVTTCVSFGRPYELPFGTNVFAFDPQELGRLFPDRVVRYLEQAAAPIDTELLKRDGKLPLTRDLPIAVATRMSLSFPGLLSMVPLWAVDHRQEDKPLQRVWFSDGGVTSNFPMHRFDGLYPLWPTLGVTLAYTGESDQPDRPALLDPELSERERLIYMPSRQSSNVLDRWNHFARGESAVKDLVGFVLGLFESARTWHDEAYLKLPGFRGRSVEIWMLHDEGGLNLAMSGETVAALSDRGEVAGQKLAGRFTAGAAGPMSWDGHRWTRFRAGMAALLGSLEELGHAVQAPPMAGGTRLQDWLSGASAPPTHVVSAGQLRSDQRALEELLQALQRLQLLDPPPFADAPSPRAELGTKAPF